MGSRTEISDGPFLYRYSGFRNFFGFSRKSTGESIEVRENAKLVMGGSDIGTDKNRLFRIFRFLFKIDRGIDP
jgi:hypothetical protein